MHRLAATVRLDLRLQMRNGFCYVLPAVVFGNLVMVNFYFVAGLVLLEKGEGTLEAQVVTPLADREYLASKMLTLAALSLVEQVVIVWSAYGGGFAAGPLVAGVVLAGVLYTLTGFFLVARYRSINEFMFPSVLFTAVLSLPMLHYFGLWDTWLLHLHPFTAPLVLLGGAFRPLAPWEWAYGVLYSAAWAGLLLLAGRRAFDRFIVAREGAR